MTRIPLFPLNTVLYPGMPLTLHIFEERYKQMVGRCVADRQPFGVVMLQEGSAEARPGQVVVPCRIGCSAVITQVQPVGMGRMNILAIGSERFRTIAYDDSHAYLSADIDPMPYAPVDSTQSSSLVVRLRGLVERYAQMLSQAENATQDTLSLPDDPLELGFLAATLLKSPMEEKQALLEIPDSLTFLEQVLARYRREMLLYSISARMPEGGELHTPFSIN
jgi:Lon protease-like protein